MVCSIYIYASYTLCLYVFTNLVSFALDSKQIVKSKKYHFLSLYILKETHVLNVNTDNINT